MKTKIVVTLAMMPSILITGLVSYHFFRIEEYNVSALLTIASYLSIVLGVHILTAKKTAFH